MIETTLSGTLAAVLQILVVLVGLFLSIQAYRGYHRHGSPAMRYLSGGIFLLTVVPAILIVGLQWLAIATDAETLLVVAVIYIFGLGAIDTAFTKSSK
jgi:heme/copper-type cytochrome/quinol oxidase subunit 2